MLEVDLDVVGIDPQLHDEGRWFDFVDNAGNRIPLKIASAENKAYLDFIREESNKHANNFDGTVDRKVSREITLRATAYHLLVDWKIKLKDGQDFEYDKEASYNLLKDDRYRQILLFVINKASALKNFAANVEVETGKG